MRAINDAIIFLFAVLWQIAIFCDLCRHNLHPLNAFSWSIRLPFPVLFVLLMRSVIRATPYTDGLACIPAVHGLLVCTYIIIEQFQRHPLLFIRCSNNQQNVNYSNPYRIVSALNAALSTALVSPLKPELFLITRPCSSESTEQRITGDI